MWNGISGKSHGTRDDTPSQGSRRNEDEGFSKRSRSGSVISSNSTKKNLSNGDEQYSKSTRKSSSRGDDRDRGFNPISNSFSSTTKSAYPGTASASVATASGNHDDEPYIPAGLVRNPSIADQMPKSRASREGDREKDFRSEGKRNRNGERKERDQDDGRREKRDKRGKEDYDRSKGSSRYANGYGGGDRVESSRAPADFSDQVGAAGFSQFPGQYDGSMSHAIGDIATHPMSSHVQDQFPGQFPIQSTAPYRPPVGVSEGGPGLAAEYYGDAGESVAEQPGIRTNTPSLIIGAEPHLLPASAVAAPPPEPSASGAVGAAASFFSGEFDHDESAASHSLQNSSAYTTAPIRPSGSHHSSTAHALPTLDGAVLGSAVGYVLGDHTQGHAQHPDQAFSAAATQSQHVPSSHQRPPSPTAESYYSNASRPSRPGKQSTQLSNVPMYAAGPAGPAGLAAAAYHQNNHPSSQHSPSRPQYPAPLMTQRHRHQGPLGAFVDFFKDPDGVAQYEEYSEFVGVCRNCFAPGSSPRDAPRKHHYRKRRSNEGFSKVDKESRYHSSEGESRRKKDQSWLATGLAGYGLAKVGESLFKQKNDFDDKYSVKTYRQTPERRAHKSQRRSRSTDRIETGITNDGKLYRKNSPRDSIAGPSTNTYGVRRRSRSRSHSLDRKSRLANTELRTGAGRGPAVGGPNPQRRKSASPKGSFVRTKHKTGESSSERRPKTHKKKKARGFFSLGSASSSSSSLDLAEASHRHRSTKRTSTKSKDDRKAEAALIGLSAAAAALAMNDGRNGHKKKGVKKLVGVKETMTEHDLDSRYDYGSGEEVWESAPENDYESGDSGLAYGGPRRRGSQESLSSQSSGTDKWGWRWGSKKRRDPPQKRKSSDDSDLSPVGEAAGLGSASAVMISRDEHQGAGLDSTSSLPLQQVFPIPTSDPTRFDVGREGSITSSGQPAVVPIQHPQPITPVSTALYSSRPPYEHSYSAPTGPPVLSRPDYVSKPVDTAVRFARPESDFPGRFDVSRTADMGLHSKPRRRDSSPAKFGVDTTANSVTPRRRSPTKDDTSIVRFDRTEEQEEDDRRERRRKRREDRERREADKRDQVDKVRKSSEDKRSRKSDPDTTKENSPEKSSVSSWAVTAAVGAVDAAVGAAAVKDVSRSEETREERRERRRKEREREEQEDEEVTRRRERRRKERDMEREREAQEVTGREHSTVTSEIPTPRYDTENQSQTTKRSRKSVWQEAASLKRSISHENYGDFFKPLDLSDDQVKVTSANADANIDFDRMPAIVTVAPKEFRDLDAEPVFSPADTDEPVDTSNISFPVPKLRLVEPTPPSSRGSTPTIQPRDVIDEVVEGPETNSPPSKVTRGEDQSHEYTGVSPVEERQQIPESPPDEIIEPKIVDTPAPKPLDEQTSAVDQKQAVGEPVGTKTNATSQSYGEDVAFAATLAASAEDAGFDPSIVIDDPKYRRRDSPPGSNDRSMPGGFDDDDDNISLPTKKERKTRDRAANEIRDQNDASNSRHNDAVVQEIINQVEHPVSLTQGSIHGLDDVKSSKKSKSRKSKAGRKESGTRDDFWEASESVTKDQELEMRQSPSENAPSIEFSAPISNDGGNSKKSRKKAKRDSSSFVDAASSVSLPSTTSGSNSSNSDPIGPPKSSIWDRVLNRSATNITQENGNHDSTIEADGDHSVELKGHTQNPEEWGSSRDAFYQNQTATQPKTTSGTPGKQGNAESVAQDSGRITQDLPAKDGDPNYRVPSEAENVSQVPNELEHRDVQRPESFLDMRPEPPPPPDMSARTEERPDPFEASSRPGSPRSIPEDQTNKSSDDQRREPSEAPPSEPLSSPTAVPFDFRFSGPRPSIGSARSMSQTRIPTHSSPSHALRPKPRPRSTEFTSSKEFRPLMLVERHRSHQDSAPEETYPSLPSSHTTSRSSSVHDPKEDGRGDYEMAETSHELFEPGGRLSIRADQSNPQSDLLDSQQATPTASSFQHSIMDQGPVSPGGSRSSSPKRFGGNETATLMLEDAALNAVVGGSATSAIDKAAQNTDLSSANMSQEEQDQFQQSLDDMAPIMGLDRRVANDVAEADSAAHEDAVLSDKELPQQESHVHQDSKELALNAEVNQINEPSDQGLPEEPDLSSKSFPPEVGKQDFSTTIPEIGAIEAIEGDGMPYDEMDTAEDFVPQKLKKGKKNKKRSGKTNVSQDQTTIPAPEAGTELGSSPSGYIDPEKTRQLQEQDAQDAVDSWFSPAAPTKKEKKVKKKGIIEQQSRAVESTQKSGDTPAYEVDAASLMKDQRTGGLERDISSDQVSDTMRSAYGSGNPGEEILQPTAPLDQDSIASQLERRQSKSKGKKAKKAKKSISQEDDTQPAFQTTEDFSANNTTVDPSATNEEVPSETTAPIPSNKGFMDMELPKIGEPSELEVLPYAIPLPIEDDLELPIEPALDTDVNEKPDLSRFESSSSPINASDQSRPREENEILEQPSLHLGHIGQEPDHTDEVFAQPSTKDAETAVESKPSATNRSKDTNVVAEPPLFQNVSYTASCDQLLEPVDQIVEKPEEEVKIADDEWAESSNNKKGKRAKKAKKNSRTSAEPGVEVEPESSLAIATPEVAESEYPDEAEVAADEKINYLTSQAVAGNSQEEPRSIEDGSVDLYSNKKGKKAKKAKKNGSRQTSASADRESPLPTVVTQVAEDPGVDDITTQKIASTSQIEPDKVEEEWTGFSSKKKAKKAKKAEMGSTDVSMGTGLQTETALLRPREEARETGPAQNDIPSVSTTQDEPEVAEDEWSEKKGEKGKKTKPRTPEAVTESVNRGIPQPKTVEPEVIEPEVAEPNLVEPGELQPEAAHAKVVGPREFQPEVVEPEIVELAEVQPEKAKSARIEPINFKPENPQIEEVEPRLSGFDVIKPKTAQPEEVQIETLQPEIVGFGEGKPQSVMAETPLPEVHHPQMDEPEVLEFRMIKKEVEQPEVVAPEIIEPKVDERKRSEPEFVKPASGPVADEQQGNIEKESDNIHLLHATTTTSREVAVMLETEKFQPSLDNRPADEAFSNKTNVDHHIQESITDQHVRDSEQISSNHDASDQCARDFELQEMDLTDQYGDADDPQQPELVYEEPTTPMADQIETQDLELIDPYGKDKEIQSTIDPSVAVTDTAKDIQHMVGEGEPVEVPGHEGKAATDSFVTEEKYRNSALEGTASVMGVITEDEDIEGRKNEDLPQDLPDFAEQRSVDNFFGDLEQNEKFSHGQQGDRDVRGAESLFDEPEAVVSLQKSTALEPKVLVSRDPQLEVADEHSTQESKEEMENEEVRLAKATSEYHPDSEPVLGDTEAVQSASVESKDLQIHEEPLSTEKSDGSNAGKAHDLEHSASIGQARLLEDLEPAGEDKSETLQQSQPTKNKKDKKKAKKAKSLAWEEETPSPAISYDQIVQETQHSEGGGRKLPILTDSNAANDTTEVLENRPKSKKERKKAKKDQSLSWESTIPSASEPLQQWDQELEVSGREDPRVGEQGNFEEPAAANKNNDPTASNIHSHEPKDQLPASVQENTTSTLSVAQAAVTPSQSEGKSKAGEANANQPVEADEYLTYSLKKSKKDKKKGKKSRNATSDDIEPQDESKQFNGGSAARGMQDEPPIVPTPEASPDSPLQQESTAELQPTELAKPDNSLPITQDHDQGLEGKKSLATKGDGDQSIEAGEDDFAVPKKGKKDKKSKKENLASFGAASPPPYASPISDPLLAMDSNHDHGILHGEQNQNLLNTTEEPPSKPEASDLPSTAEVESTKPLHVSERQEFDTERPEDELGNVPAKKGKKSKKKRKGVPISQTDFEVLETTSSETPKATPDHTETLPDTRPAEDLEPTEAHAIESQIQRPTTDLLDPLEQRIYDLQYAQELEKQGVESPRSSRVDLPTSWGKAKDTGPHGQSNQDQERVDDFQQQEPGNLQAPVADLHLQDSKCDVDYRCEPCEQNQEHIIESELEHFGNSPSPTTILPTAVAGDESLAQQTQPDLDQANSSNFEQDEGEPSQVPTEDLPTPAAGIEMLDVQEQQEYNNEYAKELERQLSPIEEDRSDRSIDKVHTPSTSQPSIDSMIGMSFEQRTPLARPPPLEDIIEESSSRSGSAQDNPDREEGSSLFKVPKKGKKGKKSKKQQHQIIWEDDTATTPTDNEANQTVDARAKSPIALVSLETGGTPLPLDLEEAIKQQHIEERSSAFPVIVDKPMTHDEADDYFTIQPTRLAEEDVGQNAENEEFRRSLSYEPTYSDKGFLSVQGGEPNLEANERSPKWRAEDEKTSAESMEYSYKPESVSILAREDTDDNFSYATTKRGKKSKNSKNRGLETVASPSAVESSQPTEQSLESGSPPMGPIPERSASQEKSLRRSPSVENEPTSQGQNLPMQYGKSEGIQGLPAAASLEAAALAAEGLGRRDSKKVGRKGKKEKIAKRADLDEEIPSSGSPLTKDEAVSDSADKLQTEEPEGTVSEEQEHQNLLPLSAIPSAIVEPALMESEITHASQSESSTYRDSAINVSESPLIHEEMPVHRPLRDSGYPETEPSPTIVAEQDYEDTGVGKNSNSSRALESDEYAQEHDQGYQTPQRGRSTIADRPQLSTQGDPSYDTSVSKLRERHRRSRSYDSDDSADSGFDVQRRRRRQATNSEAREPSPVSSTTKDRSSALFDASPSTHQDVADRPLAQHTTSGNDSIHQEPTWSFSHGDLPEPKSHDASDESTAPHVSGPAPDPATYSKLTGHSEQPSESLFGGPVRHDEDTMSDSRSPPSSETHGRVPRLRTISEDSQERLSLHAKDKRSLSDVGSPEAGIKERRLQSPPSTANLEKSIPTEYPNSRESEFPSDNRQRSIDYERSRSRNTDQDSSRQSDLSTFPRIPPKPRDGEYRTASPASIRSDNSIHALIRTPDQIRSASGQSFRSSGTPPLRRVDRSASGDLRGASRLSEAKARAKTSNAESDPDFNIPSSSTYDPVTDKGKSRAEMADVYEGWGDVRGQSPRSPTRPPSIRKRQSMQILDLETRLDQLVSENRLLQSQKSTAERNLQDQSHDHSQQRHAYEEALQEHKTYLAQKDSELNELRGIVDEWQSKVDQLTEINEALTSSRALNEEHKQRYRDLEDEHTHLKERHTDLTTGMEALVQREVASHLEAKNSELQQLRVELESAKQQVRNLQQQLLVSRESEEFVERDEDYFESQCQSLCQHVQQWVLRFSKFSDMKACYRASEIRDETKVDRMENAILDGTDVDIYLQDRVKRRDVFMAVVMTMIFDYIFTRYLFGMDREQRQKLKNLEKTLQDIGPMSAVCKWRATTLTLLMKREDFARQRATDTEAIVHEIYDTLATFLPPPSHLVAQIQDSLRKVINAAADLSIEMRTQRADYQMCPPLQPDYDTNGDLAQKVYFNALTMNERSGATTSNQALQEQGAVVRMVLFPLVVMNEEDDEQIVVCPAQVLTANSKGKKTVRVMSVQGSTQGGRSDASFGDVYMEGGMI